MAEAALTHAEQKETASLDAYELVLLAREHRHRFNKEDNAKSLELLEKSIALDPKYARTQVEIAWTHLQDAFNDYTESPNRSARMALDHANKAVEIDDSFVEAHWVLANAYIQLEMPDKGVAAFKRALELNSNHADILADWGGFVLPGILGQGDEGVAIVKQAMRLSPFHADWYNRALMQAYFVAQRYEEAIAAFQSVDYPTFNSRVTSVAAYANAGRLEEARQEVARLLELRPDISIRTVSRTKFILTEADWKRLRDGLRKAGLRE